MKSLMTTVAAITLTSGLAFAQASAKVEGASRSPTAPTKETREKMAAHHEKMASCLRSDKALSDCHDEMRASCEKDMEACPMMGQGMGMGKKGMMHKKMMHPEESQKQEKK